MVGVGYMGYAQIPAIRSNKTHLKLRANLSLERRLCFQYQFPNAYRQIRQHASAGIAGKYVDSVLSESFVYHDHSLNASETTPRKEVIGDDTPKKICPHKTIAYRSYAIYLAVGAMEGTFWNLVAICTW